MREVIDKNSLQNFYVWGEAMGFTFKMYYNRYRNVPLSCIEKFEVYVDGEQMDPLLVHLCINGKKFLPSDLPDMYNEYWAMQVPATVEVDKMGGLAAGEHEIRVYMLARAPYISVPFYVTDPETQPHTYRTSDFGGSGTLSLQK